jgi:hypothetical protein
MGLEEFGESGISFTVQPNPAREIVNCRLSIVDCRSNCSLMIYDIFGREVATKLSPSPAVGEGQGGGWTVDVSAFPPGIYLAVLREGQTVQASAKFVVAR